MKKKHIISIVISILFLFALYTIYGYKKYGHSFNKEIANEYLFLFKDSILKTNKLDIGYSRVNKYDVYSSFPYIVYLDTIYLRDGYVIDYSKNYRFKFWEFKKLSQIDLFEVDISTSVDLSSLKLYRGEVLNARSTPISIKFGQRFNQSININLDNQSTIYQHLNADNYRGFIGNVNRISFSNEKDKHIIFIDFYYQNLLFLLLKKEERFFIIMVTAHKDLPIDEKLLNFLNLD